MGGNGTEIIHLKVVLSEKEPDRCIYVGFEATGVKWL